MKPKQSDYQIFNDMKQTFSGIGFSIADEGFGNNNLFCASRILGNTPHFENDLTIGYELKAKTIRIVARLPQSVPETKRIELLELFNFMNHKFANVRFYIDPETHRVSLRGEMALFGDPLNQKNFEEILSLFFAALTRYFPKICDFLDDTTKADEIKETIEEELRSRLKEMQNS